jgi:hypothetical protein
LPRSKFSDFLGVAAGIAAKHLHVATTDEIGVALFADCFAFAENGGAGSKGGYAVTGSRELVGTQGDIRVNTDEQFIRKMSQFFR